MQRGALSWGGPGAEKVVYEEIVCLGIFVWRRVAYACDGSVSVYGIAGEEIGR